MKKFLKYLMFVMIAVVAVSTATSCSDDDDKDKGGLEGTWICKNVAGEHYDFTICFKSNGSGWMEWSDDEDGDRDGFYYEVEGNTIYFVDEYEEDWWTCTYKIKDGKLTLYGNPWGEDDDIDVMTFTRK